MQLAKWKRIINDGNKHLQRAFGTKRNETKQNEMRIQTPSEKKQQIAKECRNDGRHNSIMTRFSPLHFQTAKAQRKYTVIRPQTNGSLE